MTPPAVPSGRGSPQLTHQFLSSVPSQRGPSSLPYSEDLKWLIRQHLLSLSDSFPSLQPKTASFTFNDGRSAYLLQADGTLPMLFQDFTYNIPILIWLMETYPRHPPSVYVNPTRDMIIKRPHPHVNPSGLVSIPYLHNWVYPSSNLVDLIRNLSHFFGRDPPLYSQRRLDPNPNPNPNFGLTQSGNSSIIPPRGFQPPSRYGGSGRSRIPPRSPPPGQTEDSTEVYRRNAINKVVEIVHGDIMGLRKTREVEMEGLFNAQAVMSRREEQLSKGLREMLEEKEDLEQQLQMVLMNSDVLEVWLSDNEGKVRNLGSLDVDDAFEPCDAPSKQMLECTAMDLAMDDVIYSLDKVIQEGSIPLNQYLRNVRLLSREQFFHRALSSKIRAVQMQAQVASIAARISQFPASCQ